MELLIALTVFIVGFMVFGSILFAVAKFVAKKKADEKEAYTVYGKRISNMKVNKTHNVYSLK